VAEKTPPKVYLDDKTYNVVDTKLGGMGRVWLLENAFEDVYDPIHKRRLAVKTFDFTPQHFAIEQELNSWVALDHKNILPLLRIGRLNYRLAAIMPWLLGTLDDELASYTVFSEKKVLSIALQIAEALIYAYEKYQLVHLDLKPANVLILSREPFSIQISDWGISRIASQIAQANWSGIESKNQYTAYGAGTPLYMSPERFSGNWKITPQADMYSLGMMLVQLITGTLPFRIKERNPYEEIILGSYVENVSQILQIKSKRLERIIYSCIQPDASMRPKTYSSLISELKRC
jgi:serine/threonine protein kinase